MNVIPKIEGKFSLFVLAATRKAKLKSKGMLAPIVRIILIFNLEFTKYQYTYPRIQLLESYWHGSLYYKLKLADTLYYLLRRCKKCCDIPKVISDDRAEIENMTKQQTLRFSISLLPTEVTFGMKLHFLHLLAIGQKGFVRFLKNGVSTESSTRMSRSCPF